MLILLRCAVHGLHFYPKKYSALLLSVTPINNVKEIMSMGCGIGTRKLSAVAILKPMKAKKCKCLVGQSKGRMKQY